MLGKRILLFRSKSDDLSNEDVYEKVVVVLEEIENSSVIYDSFFQLLTDHGYHVKTISPIQFHFIHQDLLAAKLQVCIEEGFDDFIDSF